MKRFMRQKCPGPVWDATKKSGLFTGIKMSIFGIIAKLEDAILFPIIKMFFAATMMPRLEMLKRKWGARDMKHFVEINKSFFLDPA